MLLTLRKTVQKTPKTKQSREEKLAYYHVDSVTLQCTFGQQKEIMLDQS